MADDDTYRTFCDALYAAYDIFSTCPDRNVKRWFAGREWTVKIQGDVGGNRRAGLVSGFKGWVGGEGRLRRYVELRLDWDPQIFSHINVATVNERGDAVNHHLKFRNEIDPNNQSDSQVYDLMQRLTAFVNQGVPIAVAFDRIQSTF